jgi:hypothetical protein
VKDYHHQIVFSIDGRIKLTRGNEKPRPDGAGAKFVVSEAPKLPHPAYSGRNAQRKSMSAPQETSTQC